MDERVLVLGDQHPGDKEYHLFGYGQDRIWNILPLPMIDPQSQQVMLIEKLGMTHPRTQGAFCDRYNQLQF
mgnify:CR=1 FL=1